MTSSLIQWNELGVHEITLPSGAVVKVRIPDLSLLIAGDAVPESLRGIALEQLMGAVVAMKLDAGENVDQPKVSLDREKIGQLADLHFFLISAMLVEPEITVDQLVSPNTRPPNPDLEMLAELALRERDTDARGVVLGVMPLQRLERFRHFHQCDPGCAACEALQAELSTHRPRQV